MNHFISGIESDVNADEEEEKQRLISQVLELQNTLDGRWPVYYKLRLRITCMLSWECILQAQIIL